MKMMSEQTCVHAKPSKHFESLDGLRGLLILYVMLLHFAGFIKDSSGTLGALAIYTEPGHLAVPCFFILSGFLLFHQMKLRQPNEKKPIQTFYLRRFFRIMPLWWLTIIVYAVFYHLPPIVIFLNFTFLFGFVSYWTFYTPVLQAWSLFVEECFYVVFPWIFHWLCKTRNVLIGLISTALLAFFWVRYAKDWGVPDRNNYIWFSPLANFHYFFIGILTHHLYGQPIWNISWKWYHRLVPYRWLGAVLILLYLGSFFQFAIQWPVTFVTIPFLVALKSGTLFHQFCRLNFLKFFGRHCYSLYLNHLIVFQIMATRFHLIWDFLRVPKNSVGLKLFSGFIVYVAVCTLVSLVLYFLIEKPALQFRLKLDGQDKA